MNSPLPPHYYLDNFCFLLNWVTRHHHDLLNDEEQAFAQKFHQLDRDSQCLLVRMISRKGTRFRAHKLCYAEITDQQQALDKLIAHRLISDDFTLSIEELVSLLTKPELVLLFDEQLRPYKQQSKQHLAQHLSDIYSSDSNTRNWSTWTRHQLGHCYQLNVQHIHNTFMLLFFGNAYQDLTEFVLQDLGLLRYESYQVDASHRVFKNREEIHHYQQLIQLREQLAQADDIIALQQLLPLLPEQSSNPRLERRRARFINHLAYQFERKGQIETALSLYQQVVLPPARERQIRILEKQGKLDQAWQLVGELIANPINEQELQISTRIQPRLAKKLGEEIEKCQQTKTLTRTLLLTRQTLTDGSQMNVEEVTRLHFDTAEAPCLYVENQLFNSLFGLWLWPEMFRSIDGAFAHPFQIAPLDLFEHDFQQKRELQALWQLFEAENHASHIETIWQTKYGTTNPFVSWSLMDENILQLALSCIPAQHLAAIFKRLLFDIKTNRSGLPDLIQFFPKQRSYRLIEVKGPGDRVQDNQQTWLNFFSQQGIPAEVCYVSWQ